MIEISHLLKVINSYQAATGLTDSSVSTYVFNDGKKIARLRHGKGIDIRRFNYAFQWFANHWPENEPWPPEVPRPIKQETVA